MPRSVPLPSATREGILILADVFRNNPVR